MATKPEPAPGRPASCLGLQRRMMLYVLLGLSVLFVLIGYVSRTASHHSTRLIMAERLALAGTVARELDAIFAHVAPELERYGGYLQGGRSDLDRHLDPHHEEILFGLYDHLSQHQELGTPLYLALYGPGGERWWVYPAEPELPPGMAAFGPVVREVLKTGRAVTAAERPRPGRDHPALVAAVPMLSGDGRVAGVLVADLLPTRALWRLAAAAQAANGAFVLELVTPTGVVAASGPGGLFGSGEHWALVRPLIESGRADVMVHTAAGTGQAERHDHIVAFAPLASVPWGILLEQERDVALLLPRAVERQLLIVGLLALAGGLGVAWFSTRQVVRPLERLTRTAGRMAAGDLDTPVDTTGPDEVGGLARSFEAMRLQLRRSREAAQGWNQELERRVEARTRELEARNRELLALQAQRAELLRRVIGAQEEERKRVARELHDEIGQFLTGLVLNLGSARQAAEARAPDIAGRLATIEELAARAVEEVRRLVSDLRPSVLDDLGLLEAVRWYADTVRARTSLRVEVTAQGLDGRLPPHLEVVVFRVVQEALTNVVRHAEASRASIRLEATPDALRVTVADDGRGFEPEAARGRRGQEGGVGLAGMEERARLAGGTLELDSAPGRGTSVSLVIPGTEVRAS